MLSLYTKRARFEIAGRDELRIPKNYAYSIFIFFVL